MKVVAIAQARMGSTRAPGKVMRMLHGRPVLQWTIDALKCALGIDLVVLATSTLEADDVIADYCKNAGIECFRGSESDVLDRFYQCAKYYNADVVLRLTCDCPFLDPAVISEVIKLREMTNADYASNIDPPTYPDGLDVECFTFRALEAAHQEATRPSDRDCVPQFIVRNRDRFPSANLHCPLPGLANERWVLDTDDDWEFCQRVAEALKIDPIFGPHTPPYLDILDLLDKNPGIRDINKKWTRNERFYEAISTERLPPRTFTRSGRIFQRATEIIPFGAQTFSKSHLQFPFGKAPLYCSHADGARIFDVDGNDYVDLVSAILPVVLGYRDPDVDEAIRRQLDQGISFSLATKLETELTELLCHHIPCAEMVKFGKSGTDVTSAAIRLARAYTGKEHILLSGYHGWADWSMSCTDRNLGIPDSTKQVNHRLTYGDIEDLRHWQTVYNDRIAAIIVEPNDNPEYLKELRRFCTRNGILLIFDEIITGFRYDIGGAQKLWGVTPDLATFGKAMANGMPISAIVGREDIMRLMEPPNNIFYSGTMFGETLSIAAAIATINKIERCHVIDHIWKQGIILERHLVETRLAQGLSEVIKIGGEYPKIALTFMDHPAATANQIRTLFMQEMIQAGVLIINSNNFSYAHKGPEMDRIKTAYNRALSTISLAINSGDIQEYVGDKVVEAAPLRMTR